jgi:hypothetical protein
MRAHTITTKARTIVPGGILALGLAVVLLAATASTASADEIGRTEGDARAAFNAEPGGGMAIAFTHCRGEATETSCPNPSGDIPNGSPTGGIPPDRLGRAQQESVRIYPLASGSYCASGWHTIFLSIWDDAQYYDSYQDLFASLDSVDVQFAWDGVPLVGERTANKRLVDFPEPGFEDSFWFNQGTLMPPGTLSVGKHRLWVDLVDPVFGDDKWSVNITILPC